MVTTTLDIDTIFAATLETLLRSTPDIETGDPLGDNYRVSDVAQEAKDALRDEVEAFLEEHSDELQAALDSGTGYTQDKIGEDIALTRNHHGAGFWDRDLGTVGTYLTEAAHSLGSFELYVSADGTLHA